MALDLFSPDQWQAVRLSVQVAAIAALGSLPLGIAVAWLLARRDFWGKTLLETLVNLPLVLPPVVTGYLLLVIFGRQGWIGGRLDRWFGLQIVFTWKAAALASAVMAFPLMVRSIRLAFGSIDTRLEQAARTLGAGPFDAFVTITLPLARDGIIAGSVLAFARSIGEFGATIMISGSIPGETRTVPLEIYSLIESPGGADQARGLVLASILIAAVAMAGGEFLERRGRARLAAR
jgi:molybdate transport system permease protein